MPSDDSDHVDCDGLDTHGKVNKILICADSHGRDLSWHVNAKINKHNKKEMVNNEKFISVGFVNPGGRTSDVLKERNIKEELTNKEDVLVIVSGTNYIARNEGGNALAKIKETLDKFSDKRIILVDLPTRYDLVDWSCVNLATKKINEELKGLSVAYNNVTMVEASKAERHLHTSHCMHLNPKGKIWLAEKICEAAGIGSFQLEHMPSSNLRTPVDSTINLGNDNLQ
ncbi:hypothetical protein J6590_085338 [Homalodisca vitripennis]|nr:hypothetical protein J6590_085338 [Homalodisca vitripennis]